MSTYYSPTGDPRVSVVVDALTAALTAKGMASAVAERYVHNDRGYNPERTRAADKKARDAQRAAQMAIYGLAEALVKDGAP